jgi:hypothetical protein
VTHSFGARTPPGFAAGWGRPEGKNGRALPGFFSFFACTDAESLEHRRGKAGETAKWFSLRCIHRRAPSSRWEMRLPDLNLTASSSASLSRVLSPRC